MSTFSESWIVIRRQQKAIKMEITNGIVLYLEDTEDNGIRVIGRSVGDPRQSRLLAEEIIVELFGTPDIEVPMAPNQSMH